MTTRFVDVDGAPVPAENVQVMSIVHSATAGVTHGNGRVCDDDCEAHDHYRVLNEATGEYEYLVTS